ncbi:predicted protein [Nematostella vectensis]|uniref:ATP synthase subunit gamma n=1 Tax=Nematostella vectensis TaxID=45351 RepID=A7RNI6_NEMVE|nr:ATP synthase subunit gamma, mitochondrial [Nematostella vectensis]EDO46931.1 predicted protein [Nematostella vectensis]|eukprot:XP_001638994.1 predicted protein [Nematostella vectensis]
MAATGAFLRGAVFQPKSCGVRNMATLKDISLRLRSVKNIQKITKSMKMVSAAKFGRAEKELKSARAYGDGATALYDKVEIKQESEDPKHLIVVLSSDRGLCGGIHSGLAKAVKASIAGNPSRNVGIVSFGDKTKQILSRTLGKNMLMSFMDVGKKPPLFCEATFLAQEILDAGFDFNTGDMFYNVFRSVVSFRASTKSIYSFDNLNNAASDSMSSYDELDSEVIRCYQEFNLASMLFFGMKEQSCSEHSARMTAMDAATKNAGEMIDKLTLTYNRTRQAVITRELVEIISGAAAV